MKWKQFKIFLELKREELFPSIDSKQQFLISLREVSGIVLFAIGATAIIIGISFIIGFITSMFWRYPFIRARIENPKESLFYTYSSLGLVYFVCIVITIAGINKLWEFIKWVRWNWIKAGKILQEQENK